MFLTVSIDIYWYKLGNEASNVVITRRKVILIENERKDRYLETIHETVRVILSDYLRNIKNNKLGIIKT